MTQISEITRAKHEYCADAVALYCGKLVLVERLKFPTGYALPGGRRDPLSLALVESAYPSRGMIERMCEESELETPEECAIREFFEETGLTVIVKGILGVYDAPNRDPRGPKTSTVIYGIASGTVKDEPGKTKAFLMDPLDIEANKDMFVFDHYKILCDAKRKGIFL